MYKKMWPPEYFNKHIFDMILLSMSKFENKQSLFCL